jgi:serine/threonine protein kinase
MVHRDIRPDNILVSSNYTAKIGDMGIAHHFNPGEKHQLLGCLIFMPPEFYR